MSGFHPFGGRVSRRFGDHLAPEEAYLSYHDIRLTQLDIDAIRDDWLTDNGIAFWEEYLEHEYLNKNPRSKIILLRPSMSFLLMQTSDPLTLKSALPDFSTSTHIFLPVNNASEVEVAEAGSHWSLLLVSVIDAVAFHYDSLGNDNERHAHTVCDKLEVLLGLRLRFLHMRDAPQQENGSDCGVFVCMVMKHLLLDRLLTAEAEDKVNMTMRDHFVNANGGRKEILKVAEKFRKEGERRRSRSASPFGKSERSKSPPRIGDD